MLLTRSHREVLAMVVALTIERLPTGGAVLPPPSTAEVADKLTRILHPDQVVMVLNVLQRARFVTMVKGAAVPDETTAPDVVRVTPTATGMFELWRRDEVV